MPNDEPARDGLTKTGRPSRSWSASDSVDPARSTAYGPTGMPSAAASFLVNSLSIAAAEANTFAPDVRDAGHLQHALDGAVLAVRAVQHREHHVDVGERPGALGRVEHQQAAGGRVGAAAPPRRRPPAVISGSWRAADRQLGRVAAGSTQRPSRVMPTGTTSYSSGSSAPRMLPALTQEMPCSVLRPPKTIATRVLPGVVTRVTSRYATAEPSVALTRLTLLWVATRRW